MKITKAGCKFNDWRNHLHDMLITAGIKGGVNQVLVDYAFHYEQEYCVIESALDILTQQLESGLALIGDVSGNPVPSHQAVKLGLLITIPGSAITKGVIAASLLAKAYMTMPSAISHVSRSVGLVPNRQYGFADLLTLIRYGCSYPGDVTLDYEYGESPLNAAQDLIAADGRYALTALKVITEQPISVIHQLPFLWTAVETAVTIMSLHTHHGFHVISGAQNRHGSADWDSWCNGRPPDDLHEMVMYYKEGRFDFAPAEFGWTYTPETDLENIHAALDLVDWLIDKANSYLKDFYEISELAEREYGWRNLILDVQSLSPPDRQQAFNDSQKAHAHA